MNNKLKYWASGQMGRDMLSAFKPTTETAAEGATVAWSGTKTSAEKANAELAAEIARRSEMGYRVVSTNIVQAGRSKTSWAALGVANLARGKQVQATAVFTREGDGARSL